MPFLKEHRAESLTALIAGVQLREETFQGRRHAVYPVVLLVEGVHHGTAGAYYYPASVLAQQPAIWNGAPLPVFHPQDAMGRFVSANDPEVMQQRSVGLLFNVVWDAQARKLRGEIWIDLEKAEDVSPETLRILQGGERLEVSTGMWFDNDRQPGTWNGEAFEGTVTNIQRDHLALLPGGTGACSWADGCGVRVNEGGGSVPSEAEKEPSSKAKEREESFFRKVLNAFKPPPDALELSHGELSGKLQRLVDGLDGGGWLHYVREVFDDHIIYQAENTNPQDRQSKLYKRDYSVNAEDEVTLADDFMEVKEVRTFEPVTPQAAAGNEAGGEGGRPQPEKEAEMPNKDELVAALIADPRNKIGDDCKEALLTLDESVLQNMQHEQPAKPPEGNEQPPEVKPADKPEPKVMTADEAIKTLPQEMQATLNRALEHDRARKSTLVELVAANCGETFTKTELEAKEIEELEKLSKLLKVDQPEQMGSFVGAAGGPESGAGEAPDPPQVWNLKGNRLAETEAA